VLGDSLPVAKTEAADDTGIVRNGARRQRNVGMHSDAPSTECTQAMVKLHRRHYLGRVDMTCNKFDNRFLHSDNWLVTGWKLVYQLMVTILTSLLIMNK